MIDENGRPYENANLRERIEMGDKLKTIQAEHCDRQKRRDLVITKDEIMSIMIDIGKARTIEDFIKVM